MDMISTQRGAIFDVELTSDGQHALLVMEDNQLTVIARLVPREAEAELPTTCLRVPMRRNNCQLRWLHPEGRSVAPAHAKPDVLEAIEQDDRWRLILWIEALRAGGAIAPVLATGRDFATAEEALDFGVALGLGRRSEDIVVRSVSRRCQRAKRAV